MLQSLITPITVLLTLTGLAPFSVALANDHFEGRVVVEWLSNATPERDMRLLEPFTFVDKAGRRWYVPAGAIINGASIPQSVWSLVGSPYTGNYRRASVVHDYYCDKRSEPWEQVHRMFYFAMIAGGVSELQAKVFYAAVYAGGPRWTTVVLKSLEGIDQVITVPQTTSVPPQVEDDVRVWIRTTNPPLEEIEQRLNSEIIVR